MGLPAQAVTITYPGVPITPAETWTPVAYGGLFEQNYVGDIPSVAADPYWGTPYSGTPYSWLAGRQSWITYNVTPGRSLTMLWGSPDSFNTVEFLTSTGGVIGSVTGDQILQDNVIVTLTTDRDFAMIRLRTTNYAFEYAFPSQTPSPVPLPAAGVLLLGAVAGLGVLGRRRKASVPVDSRS